MKARKLCMALVAAASLFAVDAFAAVPGTVVLEGVLTSSGGGAAADGTYDIVFSVHDAKTGGKVLWSETAKIASKGGRFHHALGSVKGIDISKLVVAKNWLSLKIGADPELPRQPLHSTLYALSAGSLSCSGCVGATSLANGAVGAGKVSFAYAGAADNVKGGPAANLKCTGCVSATTEVAWDGNLDLKDKTLTAAKLTSGSDVVAKGTIAGKEFVGDGSKLTGIKQVTGECKTKGEVVKGIKADGSLICVKSVDPSALPGDGLDEISNGQLANQFFDTIQGGAGKDIPDNNPDGLLDILNFPDIGTTQDIEVTVDISNSDTGDVAVFLFPPNAPKLPTSRQTLFKNYPTKPEVKDPQAYPHYVLHMKTQFDPKNKTIIKATFPAPNKMVAGDIDKDWLNKNIKGEWRLLIMDTAFLNNAKDGKLNSWHIKIKTLSNKQVSTKSQYVDGTLWGKYQGSGKAGADLKVGGGLQIGNSTATCSAATVGTIRHNADWGQQVCMWNIDKSNKKTYEWYVTGGGQHVMWSGGCKHHRRNTGWWTYCLDGVDFNTANDYMSVNGNGTITFKKSGWYRMHLWADGYTSSYRRIRFMKNGSQTSYSRIYLPHTGWHPVFHTQTWWFRKGDTFYNSIHQDTGNGSHYTWHSWNSSGSHSRFQIEFVKPLVKTP